MSQRQSEAAELPQVPCCDGGRRPTVGGQVVVVALLLERQVAGPRAVVALLGGRVGAAPPPVRVQRRPGAAPTLQPHQPHSYSTTSPGTATPRRSTHLTGHSYSSSATTDSLTGTGHSYSTVTATL